MSNPPCFLLSYALILKEHLFVLTLINLGCTLLPGNPSLSLIFPQNTSHHQCNQALWLRFFRFLFRLEMCFDFEKMRRFCAGCITLLYPVMLTQFGTTGSFLKLAKCQCVFNRAILRIKFIVSIDECSNVNVHFNFKLQFMFQMFSMFLCSTRTDREVPPAGLDSVDPDPSPVLVVSR